MMRIPWDKYEAAILIDSYIRISTSGAVWDEEVKRVSALLRSRAVADGRKIDESFRNENGINLRLWEIKYQFTGEKGIRTTSALFQEMVLLYNTKPREFSKILREAKKCEANIVSRRRPFDLDESVILLNALLDGRNQNASTVQIAHVVSLQLRTMATNKGLIVNNSFRSIEGIKGRLRSMGAAYDGRLLPDCDIPQVFSDVVALYRNRPTEFKKVLRVALKYATLPKSSKSSKKLQKIHQTKYVHTKADQALKDIYPEAFKQVYHVLKQAPSAGFTATDVFEHLQKTVQRKIIKDILSKASWSKVVPNSRFIFKERSVKRVKKPNESEAKNGTGSRAYVVDQDKLSKFILQADLGGVTLDDIVVHMNAKGRGTKPIYDFLESATWAICMPNKRYVHRDAVIDLDDAAETMLKILRRQFSMFSGYTNIDTLFDAISNELFMFMNDNDFTSPEEIFCIAKHLFSVEKYAGNEFAFFWYQHIFERTPSFNVSNASVLRQYIYSCHGPVTKDACVTYLNRLKIPSGNISGLLDLGSATDVLQYSETEYVATSLLDLSEDRTSTIIKALSLVANDETPFVIPRELNEIWFRQLPDLAYGMEWTLLLLQEVIDKFIPSFRTILALDGQTLDTVKAAIVPDNSTIDSFPDVVHAYLATRTSYDFPFRIATHELRNHLLDAGMINATELIYAMPKALKDRRFVWSDNGESVLILK